MGHNLAAPKTSVEVVKLTNPTGRWDTFRELLARFPSIFWSMTLESASPCLIVEVLATWVKFQQSSYRTVINCAFTPAQQIFLTVSVELPFSSNLWSISSRFSLFCTFICAIFKSHIEWSNAQPVSAPTTMILQTLASSSRLVIYAPQTSTYVRNFWLTLVEY